MVITRRRDSSHGLGEAGNGITLSQPAPASHCSNDGYLREGSDPASDGNALKVTSRDLEEVF